jgi:hypothetical protein
MRAAIVVGERRVQMSDPKSPQPKPKSEPETKRKNDVRRDEKPTPLGDEGAEGEGSPGLTVGGGGGHA